MRPGRADGRLLAVRVLHAVMAVALLDAHGKIERVDLEWRQAQPRIQVRHAFHRPRHQVFETHEIQLLLHFDRQVQHGMQRAQGRADGAVLGKQHVGTAQTVEIGQVVDEVKQDGALVLRLDGAVDLAQLAHADDDFRFRRQLQQHLHAMQPGAVLVHHALLAAILVPAAQEALHGRFQMAIAGVEGTVELRQEKRIVADHAPHAQQGIAQGGAIAFAMQVGMLRQQLAQQGGSGAWQAGHADEMGCHAMVLSVQHCSSEGGGAAIIRARQQRTEKKCRFGTRSGIAGVTRR